MKEKLKQIVYTLFWKIRRPGIRTTGLHLIRPGTEINLSDSGKLCVGRHVSTHKRVALSVPEGQMTIGDYTFFNRNCIAVCHKEITIGKHCAFGPNVVIYDHDHKYGIQGIMTNEFKSSPITIEDNCWIGANVTILKGSHIGQGCVIGAGSIVSGTVPPHSLVKNNREIVIKPIEER